MIDTEIRTSFRKFEGVIELFFDETHENKVRKRENLKSPDKNSKNSQNQYLAFCRIFGGPRCGDFNSWAISNQKLIFSNSDDDLQSNAASRDKDFRSNAASRAYLLP